MPLSHQLPLYASDHPEYDTQVARLVRTIVLARGRCYAIDVGANIGSSACAILGEKNTRVLLIEGNPSFARFISRNLAGYEGRWSLVASFAGDAARALRARIETAQGTARVVPAQDAPHVSFISLTQAMKRVGFPGADLVKIDTDGFDTLILRSEREFLAGIRPVLFFEYHPALFEHVDPEGRGIVADLGGIGYRHGLAYADTGELMGSFRCDVREEFEAYARQIRKGAHPDYLDLCLFADESEFALFHESERRRGNARP
ncbi:MAG: FkbM family methyltransferase [Alphaproteobacteria bacterium]|nr:FkbM family methyltransferase [Alphaproteobacteria bacterium]